MIMGKPFLLFGNPPCGAAPLFVVGGGVVGCGGSGVIRFWLIFRPDGFGNNGWPSTWLGMLVVCSVKIINIVPLPNCTSCFGGITGTQLLERNYPLRCGKNCL